MPDPFEHHERIGPYHILQIIGEGGMGVVYEAEQRDPVRRRVAVKMMKLGMDTKEVVARFEAERQALAVMDHPGIAKVFDAGATPEGRPYFVMELVRGVPLLEYCGLHRLNTRARVELFIKVCDAVQHAHHKGVIHRDLKPRNVLVADGNGSGRPKVIDFGVAKATGQRLTEQTVVTTYGQALGTLAYMSPEQAEMSGLDIDTRSDIYSLGVTLHELLVGKVPLDPLEVGAPQFLARLVEPDRPMPTLGERLSSLGPGDLEHVLRLRGTTLQRLRRELVGDLQWIVHKSMEKDRSRRFQTVNGLAMDLERYLADEPVVARPPSAAYRFNKFVRRHRVGVAMGAAVSLLVLGFAATMAVQANTIAAERDRAEREAAESAMMSDFLTGLFQAADPFLSEGGDSVSARDLLARGADQIDVQLADRPDLKADWLIVLGDAYSNLGVYEDAETLFRSSLDAARSAEGDSSAAVAEALASLASATRIQGRLDEAESFARDALGIRRALFGHRHVDVAESLNGFGIIMQEAGRLDDAKPLFEEALSQRLVLFGRESQQVAETYNNLANLMNDLDDPDSAEVLHRRSLDIRRALWGDDHPIVATSLNNLGLMLRDVGQYERAEPLLREALAIRRAAFGGTHPRLYTVVNNLAGVLRQKGDLEGAEPLYIESLEMRRELFGEQHPSVAVALNNLGVFYRTKGDLEKSLESALGAVAIGRRAYPENHPALAALLRNLGNTLVLAGRADEAEAYLRESVAKHEAGLGPDDYRSLRATATLGMSLRVLRRFDEAETLLLRAHEALITLHPNRATEIAQAKEFLVDLYEAWGRPEQAAQYRQRSGRAGR